MSKRYNKENVFYKIIKSDLPCDKLYEDEFVLAFNDINPSAKIHILVIPKKEYVDYLDFMKNAEEKEVIGFFVAIKKIVENGKITDFKLLTNCGEKSGQVIFHFHMHILSNQK